MSWNEASRVVKVGRLFDGSGGGVREDVSIVVKNGLISEIVPTAEHHYQDDADVFPKATLLPGLIDTHVHLNYPGTGEPSEVTLEMTDGGRMFHSYAAAKRHLHAGVTTLVDLGSRERSVIEVRDAIESGTVEGPRIIPTGAPVTATGGLMWFANGEADGPWGVRRAVRQRSKETVEFIKLPVSGGSTKGTSEFTLTYTQEEVTAAIDEAHNLGLRVAAHCTNSTAIERAVDAGVDILVHGFFFDNEGGYAFRPDIAEKIVDRGVFVNPTVETIRGRIRRLDGIAQQRSLAPEEQALLDRERRDYDNRSQTLVRLAEMGAAIVTGSDAGYSYVRHGGAVDEIRSMTEAGLSASAALQSAMSTAAEAIGLTDRGIVQTGRVADFLVVDGNPLSDLGSLDRVEAVYRGGRRIV